MNYLLCRQNIKMQMSKPNEENYMINEMWDG